MILTHPLLVDRHPNSKAADMKKEPVSVVIEESADDSNGELEMKISLATEGFTTRFCKRS